MRHAPDHRSTMRASMKSASRTYPSLCDLHHSGRSRTSPYSPHQPRGTGHARCVHDASSGNLAPRERASLGGAQHRAGLPFGHASGGGRSLRPGAVRQVDQMGAFRPRLHRTGERPKRLRCLDTADQPRTLTARERPAIRAAAVRMRSQSAARRPTSELRSVACFLNVRPAEIDWRYISLKYRKLQSNPRSGETNPNIADFPLILRKLRPNGPGPASCLRPRASPIRSSAARSWSR